jgi:putative transposase
MARGKKHTAEQVVNLLRQIEVAIANGKTTVLACKEASITEQTYDRWRREYGGLQVDHSKLVRWPNPAIRVGNGNSGWSNRH